MASADPNVGGGRDRTKIPKSDFVFPEDAPDGGFPIVTAGDVSDAVSSWGRYKGSRTFAEFQKRLTSIAKRLGFGSSLPASWKGTKAVGEIKAEPMDTSQLDRWLGGKIPRRILMLPFGGPLPGGKSGLDVDGEYFDAETDIYGPHAILRVSRERLVDWHHDNDPTGVMKGAIIGKLAFDETPEDDGYWADFWANAGERRRKLVADLEKGGVPLYGSTQAERRSIRKADDGHIEVWPVIRHAITTSPQNTYAVVPPLKAVLTEPIPSEIGVAAVQAALVGLDSRWRSAQSSSAAGSGSPLAGDAPGKAGRVLSKKNLDRLERVIDLLADFRQENADRLEAALARRTQTP